MVDYEASLELGSRLSGIPTPPPPPGGGWFYPSPARLEKSIGKYLTAHEMDPFVDVQFTGPFYHPKTILATSGRRECRGPRPEVVIGEKDEAIRQWLEINGNPPSIVSFIPLSYLIHRHYLEGVPVGCLH